MAGKKFFLWGNHEHARVWDNALTDDDGSCCIDLNGDYYGEVVYSMRYRRVKATPFPWLYVDFATISFYAEQNGFACEMILEGDHYDYLARLTMK